MAVENATYENLGQIIVDLLPKETRRVLLYAEFEVGVIFPSLFYEVNSEVHYAFSNAALSDELFRLQVIFGPDVRAMEFELKEDNFFVAFVYSDKFDAVADISARVDAVLHKFFGHASVHSPPF